MNVLIIGAGYVGTTTGLLFAELGHSVTVIDVDQKKINDLQKGKLFFYEPGLDTLLTKHLASGKITFENDHQRAIKDNNLIFICVGTPQNQDGSANLHFLREASEFIASNLNEYKIIVIKSTVPAGTSKQVKLWIENTKKDPVSFDVLSNPEFLREGNALHDALYPDRIILGSENDKATALLQELYKGIKSPFFVTTPSAAELIKYTANSFLATKISFINEIAILCDKLHINVQDVAKGVGLDLRIGQLFLEAGIGYGGSCFPKDVLALIDTAKKNNIDLSILEKVHAINENQPGYLFKKVKTRLISLAAKKIAVLGLSFKAQTDDIRQSPSLKIIQNLINEGAIVEVHDPVAKLPGNLVDTVCQKDSAEEAITNADAILICTDWPQYKNINWAGIKNKMNSPIIFDGRNMLNTAEMRSIGYIYEGIGYN
ncbi:UDP-glucose/GDP-mannose dehydrogenase family protein [Fictibacillus sp. KIGAM418]|uniref:UDP-glucose 6-dehydrogenase n=1 Tax=Fictibacillus marinisediminis TaxID=2878389 RepID=A0A9X2BCA9_9BACL|nr:UDP-glucose/GDP-mannose dehydrogenase family protein [Fictibacillus marinisediminis]MCK6256779.1 UDP-glucose/GDP-mannose dehydrogenase family protein [Fictibacillus marinisediminis]